MGQQRDPLPFLATACMPQ
jgi:hypothetical protein